MALPVGKKVVAGQGQQADGQQYDEQTDVFEAQRAVTGHGQQSAEQAHLDAIGTHTRFKQCWCGSSKPALCWRSMPVSDDASCGSCEFAGLDILLTSVLQNMVKAVRSGA
jgi:hypothetical protein